MVGSLEIIKKIQKIIVTHSLLYSYTYYNGKR